MVSLRSLCLAVTLLVAFGAQVGAGTVLNLSGASFSQSSQFNDSFTVANAFDGNHSTRWVCGDLVFPPQWIAVDLGADTAIERLTLNWEASYSSGFDIRVWTGPEGVPPSDPATWTTVASVTGMNLGGFTNGTLADTVFDFVHGTVTFSQGTHTTASVLQTALRARYIAIYATEFAFVQPSGRGVTSLWEVTVEAIDPAEQLEALAAAVAALVPDMLSSQAANGLLAILAAAQDTLDRENDEAVGGQLGAFINMVEARVRSNRLDGTNGDPLIAVAQAIIAALQ